MKTSKKGGMLVATTWTALCLLCISLVLATTDQDDEMIDEDLFRVQNTPRSTRIIQTSNTNTALSRARFYIDPDLLDDLQAKVLEAVDSWGATCVEIWPKNNNTIHIVCNPNSLSKYIGLNLHLVSVNNSLRLFLEKTSRKLLISSLKP